MRVTRSKSDIGHYRKVVIGFRITIAVFVLLLCLAKAPTRQGWHVWPALALSVVLLATFVVTIYHYYRLNPSRRAAMGKRMVLFSDVLGFGSAEEEIYDDPQPRSERPVRRAPVARPRSWRRRRRQRS
jgi:hypothetical protein